MGLTIHYKFKLADAQEGMDDAQARWAVEDLRKLALRFKRQGRVETVSAAGFAASMQRYAIEWHTRPVRGQPNTFTGHEIRPQAGHLFAVGVGRHCEPLLLGLCRYPEEMRVGGRQYRTGLMGWRLHGFSKTQYASLHGWEHFRRCHTAVIDLLDGARQFGLAVEINDEGGYWPRRNLEALRGSLDEMNAAVAATAGVLKDLTEDSAGPPVQATILSHPRFERLEAEGEARGYASRLRKELRREELF